MSLSSISAPTETDGASLPLPTRLQLFWKYMASHFPFLSKRRIVEQHRARTLPALLANSICALAARFSSHPLLAPHRSSPDRLYEAATPFEEQAKLLLLPLLSFPTEETCTALILLSWNELGAGRDSGHFVRPNVRL